MTTADTVMERALALADSGAGDEQAIEELLECCAGKRVSVVMARRHLMEEAEGSNEGTGRAVELLDGLLARLPAE